MIPGAAVGPHPPEDLDISSVGRTGARPLVPGQLFDCAHCIMPRCPSMAAPGHVDAPHGRRPIALALENAEMAARGSNGARGHVPRETVGPRALEHGDTLFVGSIEVHGGASEGSRSTEMPSRGSPDTSPLVG